MNLIRENGNLNLTDLLNFCSEVIEYEFRCKGETIYHINDPSDKIYLILKGKVNVVNELMSNENNESCVFISGQVFGNLITETRGETVVADCFSDLAVLNRNVFENFISEQKQKIKDINIQFIYDNFFFQSIKRKSFENKYFKELILEEYSHGHELFKEGQPVNEIIITNEGMIELSITKSILDKTQIIKTFLNFNKHFKNKFLFTNENL